MSNLDSINEIEDDEIRIIGQPKSEQEEDIVNNDDSISYEEVSIKDKEKPEVHSNMFFGGFSAPASEVSFCIAKESCDEDAKIKNDLDEQNEENIVIEDKQEEPVTIEEPIKEQIEEEPEQEESLIIEADSLNNDIIQSVSSLPPAKKRKWTKTLLLFILIVLSAIGIFLLFVISFFGFMSPPNEEVEYAYYDPAPKMSVLAMKIGEEVDSTIPGYVQIQDTIINDINLKIYLPHNAEPSLELGRISKKDDSVILAAQAADVRKDNGGIVGAFVMNGKQISRGSAKEGFCAIIDGNITIGIDSSTELFEKTTDSDSGYFFRQYPLVKNGRMIENEPRGKSIRRSLCERAGEIIIIETCEPQSFYDFAQALQDLGVRNAIYLVGGSAYGWAVDKEGEKHYFGDEKLNISRRKQPKNISYIVWRKK